MKKITKKKLLYYYFKKHFSMETIAKLYRVSYTKIRNSLLKFEVKIRNSSEVHKGKFNGMFDVHRFGKNSPGFIDGRTLKKYFCKEIGCDNEISVNSAIYGEGKCSNCESIQREIKYKGKNNPMFGKEHNKNTKKRMSLIAGGTGIPYEFNKYPEDFYKISPEIRKRDNYTCQKCFITEEEHLIVYGRVLDVHHIDYDKDNLNESNLITTCHSCNVRANYNRDYWFAYFTYLMDEKLLINRR